MITAEQVNASNQKALENIISGSVQLIEIKQAGEVIPGMTPDTILHAGPPITFDRMCGPMIGAVAGALIYEGRAANYDEAVKLAASDKISYSPCHEHGSVGPMAGIVSYNMPVFVLKNVTFGNYSYCTLNEGLGKVLRYGAYSQEVIDRLNWMRDVLAPVINDTLKITGPIDLKNIIAQAIQMGDECHNRNRAATSLLFRELAPAMVKTDNSAENISESLNFINNNDHFFLNLSMPTCKALVDAADGIEGSTVITALSRNGTDFGIRISGLKGEWFTAPAEIVDGLLFAGYKKEDANPDIGDSSITETTGIGGFAMAAAPAIVQFVGSTADKALDFTKTMYEITVGENPSFAIPILNFRGTPTAIDLRLVLKKGILPQINTGIAHKEPGIGQVGAGLVKPPQKCFNDAFARFAEKYEL